MSPRTYIPLPIGILASKSLLLFSHSFCIYGFLHLIFFLCCYFNAPPHPHPAAQELAELNAYVHLTISNLLILNYIIFTQLLGEFL